MELFPCIEENVIIIFDLDGTLCDIEHRRHLVTKPRSDWKEFYKACVDDKPKRAVLQLLHSLLRDGQVIEIWSGREESVREETLSWFRTHAPFVINPHNVTLRMRPAGDYTPDDVLKELWLDEMQTIGWRIDLTFDDRDKVVAMWRRRGITCAQIAPGNF